MIEVLIQSLQYRHCALIALTLFAVIFATILLSAWWLSPAAAEKFANIPLSDHVEDPRHE